MRTNGRSTLGGKETLARLLTYLYKYPGRLTVIVLTGLIVAITSLASPWLIGSAIDQLIGVGQVNWDGLKRTALLLALAYLIGALAQWWSYHLTQSISNLVVADLRKASFNHISRLPLSYLDRTARGDLISRITNDMDDIANGLIQTLNQMFSGLLILVGSFALMFYIQWGVALLALAIMPLNYLVTSFIAKRSHQMFREQATVRGDLEGLTEEMIEHEDLVQVYGQEEAIEAQFSDQNERLYIVGQKAQFFSSLTNPGTRFVNNIAYVAVGIFGAFFALSGAISIGEVSRLLNYQMSFAKPINELSAVFTVLQNTLACAARVFELLDVEEEEETLHLPTLHAEEGAVCFDDVHFAYTPKRPLIKDLDLGVQPGAMVGIVGPTGAGKTTLVNLLMRFYDANQGDIKIDGQSIYQVSKQSLRTSFGMVLQDTWLFSGTVRDNIAYGKPDATDEEIRAAAVAARADGFIQRLADGYDTVLENSGAQLSQGQRQLLTIARVMLTLPPFLILDEATSSIDTRTEMLVQAAFLDLMKGRTTFVIAHRLSTIRDADHILMMEDGSIVEQGKHDELILAQGAYYNLYRSQFEEV